jgi:hypothetical protein
MVRTRGPAGPTSGCGEAVDGVGAHERAPADAAAARPAQASEVADVGAALPVQMAIAGHDRRQCSSFGADMQSPERIRMASDLGNAPPPSNMWAD